MDALEGYATIGGCARLLGSTYWSIYEIVKRKHVPTVRLYGSTAVLVRVSDLVGLVKKQEKWQDDTKS